MLASSFQLFLHSLIISYRNGYLLGVIIDSKLKLDKHVESILKSAGRKLSALSRMSNVLTFLKLRMLMKSFLDLSFRTAL